MNDISLVYYGQLGDLGPHLLPLLKIVEERPQTAEYSGLYCVEKKYGKEECRRLALDSTDASADTILLFRYLSEEEIHFIRNHSGPRKYYVLAHKYLDLEHIKEAGIQQTQLWAICDYLQSPLFKDSQTVKKSLQTKNLLRIRVEKNRKDLPANENKVAGVPVFFLFLVKILVSPLNEARRYLSLWKHSNVRVLNRAAELAAFSGFVVQAVLLKYLRLALIAGYYSARQAAGALKVLAVKAGYLGRHVLLMCGFKSFGFFVDQYHVFLRAKDTVLDLVWYRGCYFLFFDILKPAWDFLRVNLVNLLYYKIGHRTWHFLYYRVGHFLYYRVGYYIYYVLLTGAWNFLRFRVRHWLLMVAFKSYGLLYDLWMAAGRFTKLILMYPFFKIYWFTSFQYNKRIKKYFQNDA